MGNKNKYYFVWLFIWFALMALVFKGCFKQGANYDNLLLIDPTNGKIYLIQHNLGDTYYISEKVTKISGTDTTYVFE